MYVRGGGPDQNLILLDGVPIYNVDHLLGFFSVFTPEAIKKVSLFKGSFPARFGGRLSSVIDVRTNDGDMQHYHGTIGVGLLSSKLQFEGPIIKNRTSFNISGRRSYWDLVTRPLMNNDLVLGYYFYDVNLKLNHIFNERSRLFLNLYGGKDKFHSTEEDDAGSSASDTDDASSYLYKTNLSWGNRIASLRWNYVFTPKLFSNITIAYTRYNYQVKNINKSDEPKEKYRYDYTSTYESGIKDLTANINIDYHPVPSHHLKFGASYLSHDFQPEVLNSAYKTENNSVRIDTTFQSLGAFHIKGHEASLYAEDNFEIGNRLSLNAGFHFSLFNVQHKTYLSAQPRLSMRYRLSDDLALKGSYTKMNQYIHLLSNYALSMPMDLWVPVTSQVRPMRAHQYSIGIYYKGLPGWEFSAESYYKKMLNVLEYKDGASFLGNSYKWEEKVESGEGRSFGIELMAQKTVGRTNGWIAYTLAKSDRKFDRINNGERFPYKYDRRHKLTLTLNHKFSDRVDIGATWEFMTGGTATIANHYTFAYDPLWYDYYRSYSPTMAPSGGVFETDLVEKRNNYRYPSSHCLNIGMNLHKKTKHGVRTWSFSLYNVYNAMNPTFIYKGTADRPVMNTNYYRPVVKKLTLLPLIPSVTYTYKF